MGSGQGPLPGGRLVPSPIAESREESKLAGDLFKDTHSIHATSALITSLNSNYLPKVPPPNIMSLRGGESAHGFHGDK